MRARDPQLQAYVEHLEGERQRLARLIKQLKSPGSHIFDLEMVSVQADQLTLRQRVHDKLVAEIALLT
jgi:hypothetical protein